MNNLPVIIVSTIFGFIAGWFSHAILVKSATSENAMVQDRRFIIIIVSLSFLGSILSDIVFSATRTSPLMYGLMGGIVGYYFFKQQEKDKK